MWSLRGDWHFPTLLHQIIFQSPAPEQPLSGSSVGRETESAFTLHLRRRSSPWFLHTSLSSPWATSSFTLQRDSSSSTLLWRRCRMPSYGWSRHSSHGHVSNTATWGWTWTQNNMVSPSLPKLSCTSHSLSVGSFVFLQHPSASSPAPGGAVEFLKLPRV